MYIFSNLNKDEETCPVCGAEGKRTIRERNGKYYIYFYHYDRANHKPIYHYVGPAEKYSYAERKLTLGLTNLVNVDYLEIVTNSLTNFEKEITSENKKINKDYAKKRIEIIKQKINEIEKLLS